MTAMDSTNDLYALSYLRLHLNIKDQNTHQRKNLKEPYLHCCNKKISEVWRLET